VVESVSIFNGTQITVVNVTKSVKASSFAPVVNAPVLQTGWIVVEPVSTLKQTPATVANVETNVQPNTSAQKVLARPTVNCVVVKPVSM